MKNRIIPPLRTAETSVGKLAAAVSFALAAMLLATGLAGCSSGGDNYTIEGRLLHMNQGDFFIYSTDGLIEGVDTIHIRGGRFSHEVECNVSGIIMLVFPNFTEVPLFAEPGGSAQLDGDASHLKELKIAGTDGNELMTKFRLQTAQLSPDETRRHAIAFIEKNPASPVSVYLLRRYLTEGERPDLKQAERLMAIVAKAQKDSTQALQRLQRDIRLQRATAKGQKVPTFSGTDFNGRPVTNANLGGSISVIYTWASWNHDSQDQQRQLRRIARLHGSRLNLVGINLDAARTDCERALKRDSITTPVIFDERLFESQAMQALGLTRVPDNIIVGLDGRVIDHGLSTEQLKKRLEELLK